MNVKLLFFNQFGRVRSGWRFVIFLAAFIFFVGLIGKAVVAALEYFGIDHARGGAVFLVANGLFSLGLALLIGWLCGRYLESIPFRALGAAFTPEWLRHLALGIMIGAATLGMAVLISVLFGGLKFQLNLEAGTAAIGRTLLISLLVFAAAAAFEETFFRGYMLQTFSRAGLAWLAITLTSLFFGAVHYGNPNAGAISSFNTALAGVWFGIAYLRTRDLWFVFGLHLMWNWMQGAFFGIEVSGLKAIVSAPLFKEIDSGPIWLTGENYGIEGGIACTIALLFSILLIEYLPLLKPNGEMLTLTSEELPVQNRYNA